MIQDGNIGLVFLYFYFIAFYFTWILSSLVLLLLRETELSEAESLTIDPIPPSSDLSAATVYRTSLPSLAPVNLFNHSSFPSSISGSVTTELILSIAVVPIDCDFHSLASLSQFSGNSSLIYVSNLMVHVGVYE